MADQTPPKIVHPLCVYVLFHEKSKDAEKLADFIFRWLRLHDETGLSGDHTGVGVPVYYRSVITIPGGQTSEHAALTPPIPWDGAERNVIVVLSDATMNIDPAWQWALKRLHDEVRPPGDGGSRPAADPDARRLVPVMLDLSLNALAFLVADRNPLRVYDPDDPHDDPVPRWGPRLRRGLTELLLRNLLDASEKKEPDAAPARLKVFISHAKDDGVKPATAIRDGLLSVSKLEPWFDSNDITPGFAWAEPMSKAAAHATGGLIAVISPAWPTRPWCRHEGAVARTPRRIGAPSTKTDDAKTSPLLPIWSVQPAVVARVAGDRWYRLPASVAQLPTFDCPDPAPSKPWIARLVDRLLLEHLLAEIAARYARARAEAQGADPEDWYLTFVPDNYTLECLARAQPDARPRRVYYPGHALRPVERGELLETARRYFPNARPAVELIPLEQTDPPDPVDHGVLVGVSAGGGPEDVRDSGIGDVHVNDLMLRLTRRLVSDGHQVAYGGSLSVSSNYTTALITAAHAWHHDKAFDVDPQKTGTSTAPTLPVSAPPVSVPPAVNYAAWPHSESVDEKRRAAALGVVAWHTFDPPGRYRSRAFKDLSTEDRASLAGRLDGDALTAMREKLAADCQIRVFFAGKAHGWSGWLPGIAEELLTATKAGNRCLLIGGFGGLTKLLVDYLVTDHEVWPPALTWDAIRGGWPEDKAKGRERWLAGTYESDRRRRVEEMQKELSGLRERVLRGAQPGIYLTELEHFATVSSATAVVNHVARVARAPDKIPKEWLPRDAR